MTVNKVMLKVKKKKFTFTMADFGLKIKSGNVEKDINQL